MKEIWIFRHAESEANAGLATKNAADIAITPLGTTQARAVAELFDFAPALIVISPYLRTKQTAQFLIEKFPTVKVETWAIEEFTYLAAARCQNTTWMTRAPFVQEFWTRSEPAFCDGDGAESFAAFWQRAINANEQIKFAAPDKTVIFCHGQTMRAIIWLFLQKMDATPATMQAFYYFLKAVTIPNAAFVKILIADDGNVYTGEIETIKN